MFQGFSLKSFHFLLLPLSPKVCSLHLGLIGWPGHSVAGAIFLDSIKCIQFSSVAQSCPTLRAHELQHARPPCPSPTPGVYSNSCPSSPWCHPTSHPLLPPSPLALNLLQHRSLSHWVNSSHQVAKPVPKKVCLISQPTSNIPRITKLHNFRWIHLDFIKIQPRR